MSEILTIDLKELETKVENGKGFNHKEATVLLEFVRKIIGNGGTVPLQLMIPKSIAEIIDGYSKYDFTADRLIMMAYRDYQEFNDWIIKDWVKNDNIARAYLAGKALGVDLVKVVADD